MRSMVAPHSAVVVGEALVDIVEGNGVERLVPGGSPLNVAVGLARLGIEAKLLTEIGDDLPGSLIRHHLAESGVDADLITRVPTTSTAHATIGSDGSAEYDFELAWTLEGRGLIPPSDVLHVGSIGSWLAPGADVVLDLVRARHPGTLASFDPNIRPSLIGDRKAAVRRVETLAQEVDVVKLSDEDAAWLYPNDDLERVSDRFLSFGVSLLALTLGAGGSIMRSQDHAVDQRAFSTTVVDTIGAGDAFMSGMLFALAAGNLLGTTRSGLNADALRGVAGCSAASSGIVVSREGANPPHSGEIGSLMTSGLGGWYRCWLPRWSVGSAECEIGRFDRLVAAFRALRVEDAKDVIHSVDGVHLVEAKIGMPAAKFAPDLP
jgi:fructokinase